MNAIWVDHFGGYYYQNFTIVLSTNNVTFLLTLQGLFPDSCFKEVPKIPVNEAELILEGWLSSSRRTLIPAQKEVVLKAFQECPLPLFLKLSFDESCRWKSFTPANETKLASSVKNVINDFLDLIERRHGKILVSQALAYITASKNGLTEPELEDVLSLDDDVLSDVYQYWTPPVRRLPPLLWIRIRSDVEDYLIERGADDARVVYWYHRQFIEVATDRYLGGKKEDVHFKLADFFTGKWSNGSAKPYVDKEGRTVSKDRLVARQPLMFDGEKGKGRVFNLRKLNELPYHLLHAGELKRLKEEALCNFEFLLAKLRGTSLESVLDDFAASLLLYPEDEDLLVLEKTFQLSSVALKADPNQLAPQLIGRLTPCHDKDEFSGINPLLQQAYSSSVPCLIPSDRCLTSPGGSLISSMKTPGDSTSQCCGFSCDGKTAYVVTTSSSLQLQVLIINLQNGKTLQSVTIPESQDVGMVWSIQGSNLTEDLLLLAGSADIVLLKPSTGQIVQRFSALAQESQYSPMPPVSFVDKETRIVAITDEDLKIWTVQDGRLVHQIDIGTISTDEEYGTLGASGYLAAFSVHVSRSFKVLNSRTGKQLREVKVFREADACCIAEVKVTSKEQVVVTSSERNNLRLYDIHSGDLIREVPQFKINSGLLRLQVTDDGTKAVGIADYEILITNLEDGTVYKTLKSESFGTLIIHQKFYTRDGKVGISFAHDEIIRIYDLEQAVKENKKDVSRSTASKDHKAVSSVDSITYLSCGSDDRHAIATATVSGSNEVLIWDSWTDTKVRALKVTQDLPPSTIRMHGTTHAVGYIHDQDFLHFQVFNLKAGKVERCLHGKASKRTEAFGFTDESHIIAFSRGRRNLKVWNINDGKLVSQYKFGQKYRFEDMLVSRNGKAVVCSQVGRTVDHDDDTIPLIFLNPQTGEQKILEEKGTQLQLWNGSISDDGRYLVGLTKELIALLWDLRSGRLMYSLKDGDENPSVLSTAISTASNVVLTGQSDGGIIAWDITSGRVQYTFVCDDPDSLFITQDGRVAFSNYRSRNHNIDAWDLTTGLKLASFTSDWKPERMILSGNRLVVAKADKPELMSLRPHIPGYTENVPNDGSPFEDCPLESQLQPSQEFASGRDGDEDEDDDDDSDQTDIQKTELTRKAVYASPNVIIGGGSSVFASKSIFISGNVTINGIPIQDL